MSESPFSSMQNKRRVADVLSVFRPEYPYLTPSLDDFLQQSQDEQSRQEKSDRLLALQAKRAQESTPVAESGAENAEFRRVLPDVLCCIHCRAQIAFASQMAHETGTIGGVFDAYIVAPPPHNIGHTYGPVFDPEPVDNKEVNDDDPVKRIIPTDYQSNVEYAIRRRRDNLHNVVLASLELWVDPGYSKAIICETICARCGEDLGFKYIDIEDPGLMYRIGMFHLYSSKLFTQRSYASVSDAAVASMDRHLMRGLHQEEATLRHLDNTHGDQVSGLLTPPPPDVATWESRSGGTFSLADADPHGAVRSLQAQRNHRLCVVGHTTQRRLAAAEHRQALEVKPRERVTRRRQRNQGMKIAPPRPVRWNPNKDDAAHIPARCFSSEDIEEVRTQGARYFDDAEAKIFESFHMAELEDDFELSPRHPELFRAQLEARGSEHFHNDTWALRERRCGIAPQTIKFDSDDEDECEALFSGRWCSREVAIHRAKKKQEEPERLHRTFLKAISYKKAAVRKLRQERRQFASKVRRVLVGLVLLLALINALLFFLGRLGRGALVVYMGLTWTTVALLHDSTSCFARETRNVDCD